MVVALKPTDHADAAVSLEPDPIGARLVDALYAFWWRLRELYPELPSDVLIRIGEPPRRRKIGGHFRASCWIRRDGRGLLHEVMVTGQVLRGGGKLVAMLLAHEAVHAVAQVLGIKDTGERDWHNKAFKRLAEARGQIAYRIKGHGFWGTELGEELEAQLTDAIAELDAAIDVYLKADERPPVVRVVKKRKKEPIDDEADDIDEDDRVDEGDIEDEIDDGSSPPSDPRRRRATGRNLPVCICPGCGEIIHASRRSQAQSRPGCSRCGGLRYQAKDPDVREEVRVATIAALEAEAEGGMIPGIGAWGVAPMWPGS